MTKCTSSSQLKIKKIIKKNVLYESSHELGSMSWELGTTAILYRINKSSKHY